MRPERRAARRAAALVAYLLVAGGCLSALSPATAGAQLGTMPIYSLSPASGSTLNLLPSQGSTRVVFQSAPPTSFDMITGITFEVATQNILGQDGTLSDDFNVDYNYIHAGDTIPNYYVTAFRNFNFAGYPPGVYYFQFSAYTYDTHQHVVSPIYWFVWNPSAGTVSAPTPAAPAPAAAPDLSLSKAEAVRDLRYMIRHKSGHRARGLRAHCRRVTASSFSCMPRFRSGHRAYHGHFVVHHEAQPDRTVVWSGYFLGHRSGGASVRWVV